MKNYLATELAFIHLIINANQSEGWSPSVRMYRDKKEERLSLSIDEKISKYLEWDVFSDWEIEFTTEEKAQLINFAENFYVSLAQAKIKNSLIEKLNV